MALVLWGLRILLFQAPPHGWTRMISLAGLVSAGMLVYGIAASVFGAYDLRDIGRMMSRRRLRGEPGSAISSASTTET
jgi:putative peptidoglycan lipid II flippase